jgi:hypothetical protein
MAYVVVNSKTRTAIVRTNGMTIYETEAAAKAARTRLAATGRFDGLVVMGFEDYHRHLPTITVMNLMTNTPVQMPADQAGGACDPSQERYWTM